jgi:hypothetical protein
VQRRQKPIRPRTNQWVDEKDIKDDKEESQGISAAEKKAKGTSFSRKVGADQLQEKWGRMENNNTGPDW